MDNFLFCHYIPFHAYTSLSSGSFACCRHYIYMEIYLKCPKSPHYAIRRCSTDQREMSVPKTGPEQVDSYNGMRSQSFCWG